MRILYGVVGEGMGHAMRSRVVVSHLLSEGYDVDIMASQRAVDYLKKHFRSVHRIHGFHIITEENRMRKGKTVWSNLRDGATAIPQQIAAYFRLVEAGRPEVVVTDFESWTHLYGKAHRLPILSIDNMHVLTRCRLPASVLQGQRASFEITRTFVRGKVPGCDHYFITTFFYPEVKKDRTTLVPPILRPEILNAKAERGAHLLVYQTAEGHGALTDVLARSGRECRIYGMRRHLEAEEVEGSLRYRPFSEEGFIDDLRTARAVVAGGGFTLLGECVYLKKPVLSVPIRGQFEQVLNARYVEHEGYGRHAEAIDDTALSAFLETIPEAEARLEEYSQDGNQRFFGALDAALDRAGAGLL